MTALPINNVLGSAYFDFSRLLDRPARWGDEVADVVLDRRAVVATDADWAHEFALVGDDAIADAELYLAASTEHWSE